MTQNEEVLGYMREHGSITQLEATYELGCTRLGARIWEIEHNMGHAIKRENVTRTNRRGRKVSFTRYSLQEGGAE